MFFSKYVLFKNLISSLSLMKYFDSIALFEKECTLQTFWAFSSRQNSSTQVLLVMVVKHLKDIVSKTEKANLQPLLMVAFPFQQQRIATQQKTICTFMVSYMYIYCVLCPTLQWNWIASMKMLFLEVCRIWIAVNFVELDSNL